MGLGIDEAKEKELKVEREVDASYSMLRIIWFAVLAVLVIIFIVTRLVQPPEASGSKILLWLLLGVGLVDLGASFVLKQALLKKASAQQKIDQARSAYIVAFALCESIGLFGVIAHFATGIEQYYFLFVLSGFGLLLHKPERNDLLAVYSGNKF